MNGLKNKIQKLFSKNTLWSVWASLIVFLVPIIIHAQGGPPASFNKADSKDFFATWLAGEFGSQLKEALNGLLFWLLSFMGWILWLAGIVLNKVMEVTVLKMAELVNGITGIKIAWEVIRDLLNMGFILIIIYVAIAIILRITSIDTKKVLVRLIIAGLLINFSLFFTRVIIDASNILSFEAYNGIVSIGQGADDDSIADGISGAFMDKMKLATVFETTDGKISVVGEDNKSVEDKFKEDGLDFSQLAIVTIMGSLLAGVAAFVFLATAVLLMVRFVILIMLMVLSPIGIAAWILPKTQQYSRQWWKALFGQAFFAPVLLLMLLIVVVIINTPGLDTALQQNQAGESLAYTETLFGSQDGIALFINFGIIIGLMISALVIAKKMANEAGQGIVNAGTKWVGGAALGGAAFAGRHTLGRAGRRLTSADSRVGNYLRNKAAEGGATGRFASRLVLRSGDKAASGSFDARATKRFQDISETSGVDFGKEGGKGGVDKSIKERAKKKAEFHKKFVGGAKDEKYADVKKKERDVRDKAKSIAAQDVGKSQGIVDRQMLAESRLKKAKASGDQKEEAKAQSVLDKVTDELNKLPADVQAYAKALKSLTEAEKKRAEQVTQQKYGRAEQARGGGIPGTGGLGSTRTASTMEAMRTVMSDIRKSADKKLLDDLKSFSDSTT